jgi:hypothetical protein
MVYSEYIIIRKCVGEQLPVINNRFQPFLTRVYFSGGLTRT